MREILFRGKRLDNGQCVYGYYVGDCGDGISEIVDTSASCAPRVAVDPATVGQYTGLMDQSGQKIFEGDILESRASEDSQDWKRWEVSFKDGAFVTDSKECVTNGRKKKRKLELVDICEDEIAFFKFHVIGNRWDNPELLEEAGDDGKL